MIKQTKNGIMILEEIPEVELASLNNLLQEHPLYMGIKVLNNIPFGIIGFIDNETKI